MFDLIRAVPPFVAESAGLSQFDSRFTLREKVSICGAITAFVAWMVLVVWPLPSYLYAIPFLLLMSGLLMFSDFAPTPSSRPSVRVINTALGFLIVIYIMWSLFAWYLGGMHGMGISRAIPVITGWLFLYAGSNIGQLSHRFGDKVPTLVLIGISMTGMACSLHGIVQYCWLYDNMLMRYMAELQPGVPLDAIQEGIIHHLRLRRIASTLGDPNILGTLLAISIVSSLELMRRVHRAPLRFAAMFCLLLCCIALPLTGSRGAMVALGLALICFYLALLYPQSTFIKLDMLTGRHQYQVIKPQYRQILVLFIYTVLAISIGFATQKVLDSVFVPPVSSQQVIDKTENPDAGLFTRVSTIRERMNYLSIGEKIWMHHFWYGGGFGIVEREYGSLRPVDANETKYLHNLPLHQFCEIGVVGNTLFLLFLLLIIIRVCIVGLPRPSPWFSIMILLLLFIFDSLWSISAVNISINAMFCMMVGMLIRSMPDTDKVEIMEERRTSPFAWGMHVVLIVILAGLFYLVNSLATYEYKKDWIRDELRYGHTQQARELYDKDFKKPWFVRDGSYYALLSDICLREKDIDASLNAMHSAVEEQPDSAAMHGQLAELYMMKNDFGAGMAHALEAVALYPNSANHRDTLSRLLEKQGNLYQASVQANHAAEFARWNKEKYQARAQALQNRVELLKQEETIGLP